MVDNLVAFVLVGFAGWRVARLLVVEDGPFDAMAKLRARVGVPQEGEIKGFLPALFSCVHCMSFFTVAGFFTLYLALPISVIPFAAWGLAALLQRCFGEMDH